MGRKRSISGGAYKEMLSNKQGSGTAAGATSVDVDDDKVHSSRLPPEVQGLFSALLKYHVQCHQTSVLHSLCSTSSSSSANQLVLAAALMKRCFHIDSLLQHHSQHLPNAAVTANVTSGTTTTTSTTTGGPPFLSTCRQLLLQKDVESGYTPLHWAIYQGNLPMILLLLSAATAFDDAQQQQQSPQQYLNSTTNENNLVLCPLELGTQRPMTLLHACTPTTSNNNHNNKKHASGESLTTMQTLVMTATDAEGLTPIQLLELQQRSELRACRESLYRPTICHVVSRRRWSTFTSHNHNDDDEQNEFELLSQNVQWLPRLQQDEQDDDEEEEELLQQHHPKQQQRQSSLSTTTTFGCEVLTFGRAHHCALGVVASASNHPHHRTSTPSSTASKTFRPQRVQAFAQDTVGRSGGAVAVAGATHHTLVVTRAGHVYAFGLGKGGRLGTGSELPCSLPTRIRGPLSSRFVVAVAAAENHSLCVTKGGDVYSWGSNRFGQLGWSNSANSSSSSAAGALDDASPSRCCTPRRVDDLKSVRCVAVAAGEKHSVALSKLGEVYVWGDNTSGQLGISRRSGTHKVQRVELLWNSSSQQRPCIAIAASEQMTMVLAVASGRHQGRHVNSIYVWGQGSHVPSRVQFEASAESRPINPTAIACARYHNAAITSDGHVYTWGLHADALGTKKSTSAKSTAAFSTPQLVAGMLPKNGGGLAVAVAASENHTAVVTDTGALFTWGATYGKNVLGHEGVRWQPMPKRVPGVQRAVAVSAAKEHTVLLVGASFSALPKLAPDTSLETLAAHQAAKHIDLFNVLPVAVLADRFGNAFLMDYCDDFIKRNLDGVMNVCQKSVVRTLLSEQLASGVLHVDKERDGVFHPLLLDLVLSSCPTSKSWRLDMIVASRPWMHACTTTAQTPRAVALVDRYKEVDTNSLLIESQSYTRARSQSVPEESASSSRCLDLITDMDLGSKELARSKLACLSKEIRSVKKRLSQIARLQDGASEGAVLSVEEEQKVSRKPRLETDLEVFERSLEKVRRRLDELSVLETKMASEPRKVPQDECIIKVNEKCVATEKGKTYRCGLCKINCSDSTNYELHLNGRKHRNRLAQVADEERKQAAASMILEQQRQSVERSSHPAPATHTQRTNPWNKKAPRAQPKYNLPPPPVPVPHSIANPCLFAKPTKPSLAEIMAEESKRAANAKLTSKSQLMQQRVAVANPVAFVEEAGASASSMASIAGLSLPASTLTQMKSTQWASAPVYTVPSIVTTSPVAPAPSSKGSFSLGDYMMPTKTKPTTSLPPGHWCSQKTPNQPSASPTVRFTDIQQQEKEFKEKEDQSFGSNGKWFIERRERAGSFREIEEAAAKEKQYQLLVEEQLMIEKHIQEEIWQSEKKPAPKKRRHEKKPKERGNESQSIEESEPRRFSLKQSKTRARTKGNKTSQA